MSMTGFGEVATATNEARAQKRLEVVARKCDGCGTHIGRWTDSCHYDPLFDRVYCSTGGCATKMTKAPFCAGCGNKLNPFITTGVLEITGTLRFCPSCAETMGQKPGETNGGTQTTPATPTRRRGAGKASDADHVPRIPLLLAAQEPPLTQEEAALAEIGPYRVEQRNHTVFQVFMPLPNGERYVRSSVASEVRARRLAARFNNSLTN
jgi:hypothetical protein